MIERTASPRSSAGDYGSDIRSYADSHNVDDPYVNVLLSGPQGAGKTRFAMSAPDVFILDFDDGLRTAYSMGLNPLAFAPSELDNDIFAKTRAIARDLTDRTGLFAPDAQYGSVRTVVIDAYTGMSQKFMNAMMRKIGRNPANAGMKPEYDHWMALRSQMRMITNMLKRAPVHFIAIAHTDYREDAQEKLVPSYDIDGSFRKDVAKLFDEVYYMEPFVRGNDIEYRTYIKGHPAGWQTKSRTFLELSDLPASKPYVVNATFDVLFGDLWNAARSKRREGNTVK